MPTYICKVNTPGDRSENQIASLCDGEWDLRTQAEALSAWLEANSGTLQPGEYVADIGFCWRRNACGGGAALDPQTLRWMADAGIYLHLSEYSGFSDED